MIFIYSGVFSPVKANHLFPSFYQEITGKETISTGLSRAFSYILRGNTGLARQINPYSFRIFLFFFVQFLMRIAAVILLIKFQKLKQEIITTDILISAGLLFYCFWPFFRYLFYLSKEIIE